ncbi:MAG: HIT domain-containing protein [Gammaproteobacteria bacterium]
MQTDCIFCRIISGSEQARVIYEDARSIAFFPRTLYSKGHTLILPKEHYSDIFDMPGEIASSLMKTSKKLSEKYRKILGCEGVNLMNASGAAAQQSVFHFHFHLMPRFIDDGINTWPGLDPWEGDIDGLEKLLRTNTLQAN